MHYRKNTVLVATAKKRYGTLLKRKFSKHGFHVESARMPNEVLNIIKRNTIRFAVIDTELEDIEGDKVIHIIKKFQKNVRLVVTTSHNNLEKERFFRQYDLMYYAILPGELEFASDTIMKALNSDYEFNLSLQ